MMHLLPCDEIIKNEIYHPTHSDSVPSSNWKRRYYDDVKHKKIYKKDRSKSMRTIFALSRPRTIKLRGSSNLFFVNIRRVLHAMRLMDEVKNGVWVECMMTNVLIKKIPQNGIKAT
jgi:hypothetical protein